MSHTTLLRRRVSQLERTPTTATSPPSQPPYPSCVHCLFCYHRICNGHRTALSCRHSPPSHLRLSSQRASASHRRSTSLRHSPPLPRASGILVGLTIINRHGFKVSKNNNYWNQHLFIEGNYFHYYYWLNYYHC